MPKPMQSLADFKRRAKPGAQFLRSFPGQAVRPRIVTVAYAQSNAVVFPPNGYEATAEISRASPKTRSGMAPGSGSRKPDVAVSRTAK